MANAAFTRNQKCFPVLETTFGTAVTPIGTNACLITSLTTQAQQPIIDRPDKTGNLSQILGIPGRKTASWSASMSMAANGAAGVKPDYDVLNQLIFGKAAVVVGGTSVTYGLDDNNYSASIWNYNDPSTVAQYVSISSVCNQLKISFGGDVPTLEYSGSSLWVLDTDQLADGTMDSVGKGGLSSFPAQPTPTTNGKPPAGFVGLITLDGNVYSTLRSGSITLSVARNLPIDAFNSYYGTQPVPGIRAAMLDFSLYDDDSTILKSLKQKSFNKSTMNLAFQIGTVAGNIHTFNLKNVLLPAPAVDQGSDRRGLTFSGAKAYETSIGSKDEMNYVIT